jgi:hypothetical protein
MPDQRPVHHLAADEEVARLPKSSPTLLDELRSELLGVSSMAVATGREEEAAKAVRELARVGGECVRRNIAPAFEAARSAFRARIAALLAMLLLLIIAGIAGPAGAVCTQHGTATSASSTVVSTNDLATASPPTVQGRHYFMIQNTGASNPMNVAIGSNNNASPADMYLGPGAAWVMGPVMSSAAVPGGDVAVISPSSTTYAFCDW